MLKLNLNLNPNVELNKKMNLQLTLNFSCAQRFFVRRNPVGVACSPRRPDPEIELLAHEAMILGLVRCSVPGFRVLFLYFVLARCLTATQVEVFTYSVQDTTF